MTVKYLDKKQKEEYAARYPFLKHLLVGDIISVEEKKVKRLPKPVNGSVFSVGDCHFDKTSRFEDANNIYQVHDHNFFVDWDDDQPITVSDHELVVYVLDKILKQRGRLFLLSGPSVVGKDPLTKALEKFTDIKVGKIKIWKGREPRFPGEDHIMPPEEILKKINDPRYIVGYCRDDIQMIDLAEAKNELENKNNDIVILNVYCKFIKEIFGDDYSQEKNEYLKPIRNAEITKVFISPFSEVELNLLKGHNIDINNFITNTMLSKQICRAEMTGKKLDVVFEDLVIRAKDAFYEMKEAHKYDVVLPSHASEDIFLEREIDNLKEPTGELKITIDNFVGIIDTGTCRKAEKWTSTTV